MRIPVTGLVLSGGGSRRMGQDKALILHKESTLLAHAVELLRPLCKVVNIVSSHPNHTVDRTTRIPDAYPNAGPLGGILSGLLEIETNWALVVACDMPHLNGRLLAALMKHLDPTSPHSALLFQEGKRWQPLSGLYAKSAIPTLEAAVSSNQLRMMEIIPQLNPQIVPANANLPGWFPNVFDNWNSPGDIQLNQNTEP